MVKPLTLSVIILAYNEETYIKSCLDAIAAQTVMPDEVIVVDNNSTDNTAKIARSYDFVTLIHEPIQGMISARNAGFSYASSDVLARIDADTQLLPGWVEHAKKIFQDDELMAATGPALTLTTYQTWIPRSRIWSLAYFRWTEAEFGIPILWGANMLLRRQAWEFIKDDACPDDSLVHEDQDLSYLLAGRNLKTVRDNKLLMSTSGESYHEWAKFSEYVDRRQNTKRYHKNRYTLQASTQKLTPLQRVMRFCLVLIPGIPFVITSIPLGIVDAVIARLRYLTSPD